MSFDMRSFVKTGLRDAIGKMADYQIIFSAAGWLEKGVLTEEDLAEIDALINANKNEMTKEDTYDTIL